LQGFSRLALAALTVLVLEPRAHAQARDAAAGEALFQEGRRLMKAGDFATACPKLEESLRLDPALGTLVNLASCEEQQGRTATAWQHWRSAIEQLPAGDKRRTTAVARAAALEKLLARLTIALAPDVSPEAEVKRDGVRLGRASLGLALPVDPGKHVVVVAAPGREPREYEVTLKAKDSQTMTVEAGAEIKVARPAEAAPERWGEEKGGANVLTQAPPPPDKKSTTSVLGWTLLGTGAAALAGAGYFGLQALSARKDAEKSCPGEKPSVCSKDAKDALARDKRSSLFADVGAAAGVVLVSAGLYFVIRGPGGEETATAQVTPLPGGGAFSLTGRF
jgi:tetratricopeptide (TPR) repeat protein